MIAALGVCGLLGLDFGFAWVAGFGWELFSIDVVWVCVGSGWFRVAWWTSGWVLILWWFGLVVNGCFGVCWLLRPVWCCG